MGSIVTRLQNPLSIDQYVPQPTDGWHSISSQSSATWDYQPGVAHGILISLITYMGLLTDAPINSAILHSVLEAAIIWPGTQRYLTRGQHKAPKHEAYAPTGLRAGLECLTP